MHAFSFPLRTCGLLTFAITSSLPAAVSAQNADPASGKTAKIVHQENVVYGQVHGAGLLADIAYPESKAKLPAIISVHGGRWMSGNKRDASTIKVQQWAG